MLSLDKLIEKSASLGSLPAIVHRVFEAMDDPKSTAIQIGRVINEDPALTARLLKLVNSPFYGFASKVDTVYRAIALIGHKELRSVVLAASAVKVFSGIPSELVNMQTFWRRSLYTAVVSRVLAAYRRESEIERFFIAGLLHDIGSLLLYLQAPDEISRAMARHQDEGVELWVAEREEMGFDHAEAGGSLLKKWSLPPLLCQAVRFHLYPDQSPETYRDAALLVHLAWQIVRHHIDRDPQLDEHDEIPAELWQANKLSAEILTPVLEKAEQQFAASRDIFLS
jgi:HD-like signal output (HDOD) protein